VGFVLRRASPSLTNQAPSGEVAHTGCQHPFRPAGTVFLDHERFAQAQCPESSACPVCEDLQYRVRSHPGESGHRVMTTRPVPLQAGLADREEG
jgi:hypothetical protein